MSFFKEINRVILLITYLINIITLKKEIYVINYIYQVLKKFIAIQSIVQIIMDNRMSLLFKFTY